MKPLRSVLHAKIHNARVTEADIRYLGSITIDRRLMDKVGLWPGEKVLVVSNDTGVRLETYVIEGKSGSGVICMNGAAARLVKKGESVIIMAFELRGSPKKAKTILVDAKNRFLRFL